MHWENEEVDTGAYLLPERNNRKSVKSDRSYRHANLSVLIAKNPPNYTPPCESDRLLSQLGRFFRRECDIARWSARSGFGWV